MPALITLDKKNCNKQSAVTLVMYVHLPFAYEKVRPNVSILCIRDLIII